jgi:hypothetical protein
MMLRQDRMKQKANQRAPKDAREHDQTDCDGTHD